MTLESLQTAENNISTSCCT